jgi:hypothetical protein
VYTYIYIYTQILSLSLSLSFSLILSLSLSLSHTHTHRSPAHLPHEPEISEEQFAAFVQQEVPWFDVSVHLVHMGKYYLLNPKT